MSSVIHNDGDESVLQRVVTEDIGKGCGDNRTEAERSQRPGSVLTARAASEVVSSQKDFASLRLGFVDNKIFFDGFVIVITPVIEQRIGKVVLVGDSVAADGSSNFVLARLNADGTPDEAFGVAEDGTPNGFVSTSLGEGNDYATGLAIQGDGKLVVAGYHQEGESTNIAVARYEANGDLDQAFGTADDGTENGIVNISLGDGDDMANAVAVQGDKLIVVAGTTTATDGSKNIAVLRLTAQ